MSNTARDTLATDALLILDALMRPEGLADAPDPTWTPDLPVVRIPSCDGGDYDTYWLSLRLPVETAVTLVDEALVAVLTDDGPDGDDPLATLDDPLTALAERLRPVGIIPLYALSTTNTL